MKKYHVDRRAAEFAEKGRGGKPDDLLTTPKTAAPAKQSEPVLANELLQGAAQIGDFLGFERSRTFRLLEKGDLPAFKLRGKWCARKSTLLKHIEKLESAAA